MNKGTPVRSTWREIRDITFGPGFYPEELVMRINADGFLKQMVRNIAGALVSIGQKKYPCTHLQHMLASGRRAISPATAPPSGLNLEGVEYPEPYR